MLHLIINPAAGSGRARRTGEQVLGVLDERAIAYTAAYSEHIGHATELARAAAAQGAEAVIAVGGDGTLREVAQGLVDTQTALGIIPAGTGNDVVKMLSTPREPMEALDFILDTPARRLDVGQINDSLFLNVSGTGFDVCVLEHAAKAKKHMTGILPYLVGVIGAFFAYKPQRVEIFVDGEAPVTHSLLVSTVGNGRYIGGGMNVAPDAMPDDGLFDLMIIDMMPKIKIIPQFPKLLDGRIREVPGVIYRKCREVTFRMPGMHVNIDGEIIPMDEARMTMRPGALLAHW